ncbi:hypothetical protein AX769_08315 [Frondihabitans sp. PAMC 28766]|uniref:hypothetical protein n=1 Tax=Frondihabitans sp. PAMC 28766 TaxID=1795630 RepID=UPI00078D3811|nr:hypothetical protein [Frondihabitans sp. PAMC 28766]AMM20170.1 hypothetical protein AX769_08315 [Frondihabitans sp. PAMC 28766]
MHSPSLRTRKLAIFTVGPAAILVAGLLVWHGSVEAFSAQTSNVGNNWSTGSVTLSDDDAGAAAFTVLNVTPGQTGSRCIKVTSTSTVPGIVKTYIARLGAQGLENNITIATQEGSGGSFASCSGFVATSSLPAMPLATAAATITNYSTGVLPWATTGVSGESKTYEVTWTFDTTGLSQTAIDALQGKSVSADVVWELQSN